MCKAKIGTKKIPVSRGAGTDPKHFKAMKFVDRTRENESAGEDPYNPDKNSYQAIPGHKRMAGMP